MSGPILHKSAAILLVGAAPTSPEVVTKGFSRTKTVVAADGGLALALCAGVRPNLVIGDLDSIHGQAPKDIPVHQDLDQNTTDFQKCLAKCDADIFIGVGFLGGRLDHQLAAFSAIIKDGRSIVLIDDMQLVFMVPRYVNLDLPDGEDIGFFPLASARVDISGVAWPVVDQAMHPQGLIATSNKVKGGPVEVRTMGNGLLAILPVAHLDVVVAALRRG